MAQPHDDDLFAETRMSFGDHIEDLRRHLWKAIAGFTLGMVVSFFFGHKVVHFITTPVEDALVEHYMKFYKQNEDARIKLVERFWTEIEKQDADPAFKRLNDPRQIPVQLSAQELDAQFRRLYPPMFQPGGPLAETAPPSGDAPALRLAATVRPMEVIRQLQEVVALGAKRTTLTTLSAPEMFMVFFKVCILTGFVFASPWVFYQVWQFVAAGLYPQERKYVYWSLGPSIFLFLAGVALCQFLIIPTALGALLDFNLWLGVEPDFRLNEWLGFAIMMPVCTGLFFQTPLVMLFLGKIGVFTAEDFATKRRMAIFVMLIIAAIISPTIDMVSLLALWLPMVVLYEVGIVAVRWYCKPMDTDGSDEVPYQPETAGVGTESASENHQD